jgi:hypothetical protein
MINLVELNTEIMGAGSLEREIIADNDWYI